MKTFGPVAAAAVYLVSGCAAHAGRTEPASAVEAGRLSFEYEPEDSSQMAALESYSYEGVERVENFFGARYLNPVTVVVLPDRAAFDAYAAREWGMPQTQCWMVGAAATNSLVLVSPRHWSPDCDHDPNDATHVRDIVVHELVHVYHMQHNPSDEFEGADEVGWFVEGLATYASGQLETGHADRAREAVETGAVPARLMDAWSGPYRYGVAGSLAAFIDETVGRDTFVELLGAATQDELLSAMGMTETQVLEAWADWVKRKP